MDSTAGVTRDSSALNGEQVDETSWSRRGDETKTGDETKASPDPGISSDRFAQTGIADLLRRVGSGDSAHPRTEAERLAEEDENDISTIKAKTMYKVGSLPGVICCL